MNTISVTQRRGRSAPTRPRPTRAIRAQSKNVVQQDVVSMMSPTRITNFPSDPADTLALVDTKQTFTARFIINSGTGAGEIDTSTLMAFVPGGTTFWSAVRFDKFIIYGSDVGTGGNLSAPVDLRVTVANTGDGGVLALRDLGTAGARRPAVAYRPGLMQRAAWVGPADNNLLFSITRRAATAQSFPVTVQFTAQLRSPANLTAPTAL